MTATRLIKLKKNYVPMETRGGDEFYPNGIFNFNISRILEDIASGRFLAELEDIDVCGWFGGHLPGSIDEAHLPSVDLAKPVIQAEIRPGRFEIIDGNHRMEQARRENRQQVASYKVYGEQLLPYFKEVSGYQAFVRYWNGKVKSDRD